MSKKILIKLSGEALSQDETKFNEETLVSIAESIKSLLDRDYQIALVVGGGNLFRGKDLSGRLNIARPTGDYIGMLATVQNALVLRDFFNSRGMSVRVQSAINMDQVCEPYIPGRALRHLKKGRVVIFAAGLGSPFFTTDSTAAQRALELDVDTLIMAKNGVDAVYSDDPDTNPGATKFNKLTATETLEKNLRFADASAVSLARDHNLKIRVVSMDDLVSFDDETLGTTISPE